MPLSPLRARFVDEYMIDRNATQACIRAGYSPKAAKKIAYVVLNHHEVRAEIDRRTAILSEQAGVRAAQVVEKLAAIVNANIGDYLVAGPDGQPRLDLDQLKGGQGMAIQDLVTEDGARIRMHDKVAAADKLLRHIGGYKDRVEITGRNGGPIELKPVTNAQRLKALMALIDEVESEAGDT